MIKMVLILSILMKVSKSGLVDIQEDVQECEKMNNERSPFPSPSHFRASLGVSNNPPLTVTITKQELSTMRRHYANALYPALIQ